MPYYGLHGKLTAQAGKQQALAEILLQAAQVVASMDGCHLYMVSNDPADPNAVWITEKWESKEAHANSLKNEDVRALITQAMPLLDGMPTGGQELEVLGGHVN